MGSVLFGAEDVNWVFFYFCDLYQVSNLMIGFVLISCVSQFFIFTLPDYCSSSFKEYKMTNISAERGQNTSHPYGTRAKRKIDSDAGTTRKQKSHKTSANSSPGTATPVGDLLEIQGYALRSASKKKAKSLNSLDLDKLDLDSSTATTSGIISRDGDQVLLRPYHLRSDAKKKQSKASPSGAATGVDGYEKATSFLLPSCSDIEAAVARLSSDAPESEASEDDAERGEHEAEIPDLLPQAEIDKLRREARSDHLKELEEAKEAAAKGVIRTGLNLPGPALTNQMLEHSPCHSFSLVETMLDDMSDLDKDGETEMAERGQKAVKALLRKANDPSYPIDSHAELLKKYGLLNEDGTVPKYLQEDLPKFATLVKKPRKIGQQRAETRLKMTFPKPANSSRPTDS